MLNKCSQAGGVSFSSLYPQGEFDTQEVTIDICKNEGEQGERQHRNIFALLQDGRASH